MEFVRFREITEEYGLTFVSGGFLDCRKKKEDNFYIDIHLDEFIFNITGKMLHLCA